MIKKIRITGEMIDERNDLRRKQIKCEIQCIMKRKIINKRARELYGRVQIEEEASIDRAIDTLRNKSIDQLQDEYRAYLR